MGGGSDLIDRTVIILDRLGGMYSYELPNGPFEPLQKFPRCRTILRAILPTVPAPLSIWLTPQATSSGARDLIYLADRRELAATYDKFDETTGKIRTVVSVIPSTPLPLPRLVPGERSLPVMPSHTVFWNYVRCWHAGISTRPQALREYR